MPYKIFTHTFASPIQGGPPIWDGTTPFQLPRVNLDSSSRECGIGGGWHYCEDLSTALRVAGLWPDGWSAVCVEVDPAADAIHRGQKSRASQLEIVRILDDGEIQDAIRELSQPFAKHAEHMVDEQWAWFEALRRPRHRKREVERALRRALKIRDLTWSIQQCETWDAWDARVARDARAAWDARVARVARAAWAARAARDTWATWAARAARDTRAAWDTWAAWTARDALVVNYVAICGWTTQDNPELLTKGIRDAYLNGASIVVPTGPFELGWTMSER